MTIITKDNFLDILRCFSNRQLLNWREVSKSWQGLIHTILQERLGTLSTQVRLGEWVSSFINTSNELLGKVDRLLTKLFNLKNGRAVIILHPINGDPIRLDMHRGLPGNSASYELCEYNLSVELDQQLVRAQEQTKYLVGIIINSGFRTLPRRVIEAMKNLYWAKVTASRPSGSTNLFG